MMYAHSFHERRLLRMADVLPPPGTDPRINAKDRQDYSRSMLQVDQDAKETQSVQDFAETVGIYKKTYEEHYVKYLKNFVPLEKQTEYENAMNDFLKNAKNIQGDVLKNQAQFEKSLRGVEWVLREMETIAIDKGASVQTWDKRSLDHWVNYAEANKKRITGYSFKDSDGEKACFDLPNTWNLFYGNNYESIAGHDISGSRKRVTILPSQLKEKFFTASPVDPAKPEGALYRRAYTLQMDVSTGYAYLSMVKEEIIEDKKPAPAPAPDPPQPAQLETPPPPPAPEPAPPKSVSVPPAAPTTKLAPTPATPEPAPPAATTEPPKAEPPPGALPPVADKSTEETRKSEAEKRQKEDVKETEEEIKIAADKLSETFPDLTVICNLKNEIKTMLVIAGEPRNHYNFYVSKNDSGSWMQGLKGERGETDFLDGIHLYNFVVKTLGLKKEESKPASPVAPAAPATSSDVPTPTAPEPEKTDSQEEINALVNGTNFVPKDDQDITGKKAGTAFELELLDGNLLPDAVKNKLGEKVHEWFDDFTTDKRPGPRIKVHIQKQPSGLNEMIFQMFYEPSEPSDMFRDVREKYKGKTEITNQDLKDIQAEVIKILNHTFGEKPAGAALPPAGEAPPPTPPAAPSAPAATPEPAKPTTETTAETPVDVSSPESGNREPREWQYVEVKNVLEDSSASKERLNGAEVILNFQLKSEPNNPWYLHQKARLIIARAQKDNALTSVDVETALRLEGKAIAIAPRLADKGDSPFNLATSEYLRLQVEAPVLELRRSLVRYASDGGSSGSYWDKLTKPNRQNELGKNTELLKNKRTAWVESLLPYGGFDVFIDYKLLKNALYPEVLAKLTEKFPERVGGVFGTQAYKAHVKTVEELHNFSKDVQKAIA